MSELLERMGIDVRQLGCLMLDVSPLTDIQALVPPVLWYYGDRDLPGVLGPETEPHVTLLFGLMESAHVWKEHIVWLLEGWEAPATVRISHFDVFGSPDNPYDVLVGVLDGASKVALEQANARLKHLPHVDTFPYEPHITVGTVLKGTGYLLVQHLNPLLRDGHTGVRRYGEYVTGALNYGKAPTP